jgi:transcriptional regulator with GAF, ATPase, and Fis domain
MCSNERRFSATAVSLHRTHLDLPTDPTERDSRSNLDAIERRTIEHVMAQTRWNESRAADRLGLTRTQLYGRLRKYELERPTATRPPLAPRKATAAWSVR